MTTEADFTVIDVTATEDLSANGAMFKAVSIAGTIAATPSLAIGILRSKGASGAAVSAVLKGITKAVAGAVVTTPGFPVKVAATSGFLIAAASGDTHCGRYLGTAACASGDLIPVAIDFTTKPAWAGT